MVCEFCGKLLKKEGGGCSGRCWLMAALPKKNFVFYFFDFLLFLSLPSVSTG